MDLIFIILITVAAIMAIITFLQYNKTQKAKRQYMQPTQPPQFNPQARPNPYPEYNQQIQPMNQPNPQQNIRQNTENINRIANKDYRAIYQNLAQEMQTQKTQAKQNFQSDIQEQKKIYETMARQKNAKGKNEFDRTVDEQNWERNNLWAINEAKQPTQKAEFLKPELDQQQYWSQHENLVYILLGIAGFILFMVMVL